MITYKHALPALIVLADPEHKGKHPCHDSRYVATADATWDDGVNLDENEDPIWIIEKGSIVAEMTDCEHQAQFARLFAKAPEMLAALRRLMADLQDSGEDKDGLGCEYASCNAARLLIEQFTDIA